MVHPKYDEVAGYPCYPSVADLPEAPDAAFVGVRRELTAEVVRELAARGAGGCVCYAAGFAELGEKGRVLQEELAATAGDMALVGPNSYGLLNYLYGALFERLGIVRADSPTTFAETLKLLSAPKPPKGRRLGVLAASGGDPGKLQRCFTTVMVGDSATLLLPTGRRDVERALDSLKASRLIAGFRGGPEGDREAVVESVLSIAAFAGRHCDCIEELDVNPLLVLLRGRGAIAADALIRMQPE